VKYYRKTFFVLVTVFVVLDQITKAWIRGALPITRTDPGSKIRVVDGFFNIVHAKNPGAAFGILGESDHRMLFFTVVTLTAFVLIIGYYRQLRPKDVVLAAGLSFVFAGALGNFIDRLLFREVTDFLQFYASGDVGQWLRENAGTRYWPAFNVADICINVGVGLFIIHVLFLENKNAEDDAEPGADAAKA
jgi:signal peptidase II